MDSKGISEWVDGISLDLANIASDDQAWGVRMAARKRVYEARGLKPEPWPRPDDGPGQIPMCAR